jgi:hypothetical protein
MLTRPKVHFCGDTNHADFREAADMLRAGTSLVASGDSPELVVVAHSRPGSVGIEQLQSLRRSSPLASVVVLAGSWCEGELRTGRAWPGVYRLYWYEFPAWWRRQLTLRAAGCCPDWSRSEEQRMARVALRPVGTKRYAGFIILNADATTCDTLADVLSEARYASVRATAGSGSAIRGADAAIWDGAQLSGDEERKLSRFCASLAADRTPVVALLDFPRRDRLERAKEIGATAVLGKPWVSAHLLATIEAVTAPASLPAAA